MTALYICYQSVTEPLTETQVVAYLEGLARAGYAMLLLTFEGRRPSQSEESTIRGRLRELGIQWFWLPYHKRPSLPATAFDVLVGTAFGLRLVARYHVSVLHARSHVAGLIARIIKSMTCCKLLFDVRGLMAEEYVDAGNWRPGGVPFRVTKWFERRLIRSADAVVVLTFAARDFLEGAYRTELEGKRCAVIPCCVDLRHTRTASGAGPSRDQFTLVYVGKLGGWYPTDHVLRFAVEAKHFIPDLTLVIWTQSDPKYVLDAALQHQAEGFTTVRTAPPRQLAEKLPGAHAGLSFRTGDISRVACSPTKVPEYLAAGLPVITSRGIGDCDALLLSSRVGVVIDETTQAGFQKAALQMKSLVSDPETSSRCKDVAKEMFDLVTVGWARYAEIYCALSKV